MDLYISNLPQNLDEDHLRILFERFGHIISTTVVKDSITGRGKGFGFVKMDNSIEAERAIDDMNGRELAGKNLIVMEAKKGYSGSDSEYNQERESPNTYEYKKPGSYHNNKWDNRQNFDPEPYKNEKIDLEVKDETEFSKEKLNNGFVQIKFKK